jgi:hypothetical protein
LDRRPEIDLRAPYHRLGLAARAKPLPVTGGIPAHYRAFEVTNQNVSFWRFWLFVIK